MSVCELVITVVEEFVAYYRAPERPGTRVRAARPRVEETLETVWRPHRDAPSLLGVKPR